MQLNDNRGLLIWRGLGGGMVVKVVLMQVVGM